MSSSRAVSGAQAEDAVRTRLHDLLHVRTTAGPVGKPERPPIDVDPVEHEHVHVEIEVQRGAESLGEDLI